jgi:hypothetical protein
MKTGRKQREKRKYCSSGGSSGVSFVGYLSASVAARWHTSLAPQACVPFSGLSRLAEDRVDSDGACVYSRAAQCNPFTAWCASTSVVGPALNGRPGARKVSGATAMREKVPQGSLVPAPNLAPALALYPLPDLTLQLHLSRIFRLAAHRTYAPITRRQPASPARPASRRAGVRPSECRLHRRGRESRDGRRVRRCELQGSAAGGWFQTARPR